MVKSSMFYSKSMKHCGVFLCRIGHGSDRAFQNNDSSYWDIAESKNQSAEKYLFTDETPRLLNLFVSLTKNIYM